MQNSIVKWVASAVAGDVRHSISRWLRMAAALACILTASSAMAALPGAFSLSGNAYCNTSPPAAPAVKLTWNGSSGATSYTVYRNGSAYAGPYGSSQVTFDNTANVTAGVSYTYFIRASNGSGSTDSNTISVSVPSNVCSGSQLPGAFSLSGSAYCNTSTPAISLSWGTSSNATSYTLYRNGSVYAGPYGSTQLTYNNTANVTAGTTYTYYVHASNANGSTNSNTLTVTVPSNVCGSAQLPGAFTLSGNAYCDTSPPASPAVSLSWGASSNVTSYTLYRNGSAYAGPYGSTQLTYNNTANVSAGTSYTYFVRATNSNGSTDSNTITVAVPSNVCGSAQLPGAFTLSGNAYCDTSPPASPAVSLSWGASSNVTSYTLYRNGAAYAGPYGSTQLTYANTANVSSGTSYTYFVRASNANGSTDSNTINVAVPANVCGSAQLPGAFTLSGNAYCDTAPPASPAVSLSWGASSNTTSYTLYRNGTAYAGPYGSTQLTYANTANVTAGTTYTYFVKATNANGSTNSNTITVAVPANVCGSAQLPGAFSLSGNAYCNTSPPASPAVSLAWSTSSNATSYTLYRNGTAYAGPYGSTQLTYNNTANVTAGATYTYFVRATNANGSTDSNTLSVPVPANVCSGSQAPGAFTLSGSAYCDTSPPASPAVSLSWGASSNATSYTLYRNGAAYAGPYGTTQLTYNNTANVTAGTSYTYFVRATNATGSTDSNSVNVAVPASVCGTTAELLISTSSLPGGNVGIGYGQGITATGGQTPYTWSVSAGLPPGLTLNTSVGSIFGTPSTAGNFSFGVTVTDSSSPRKVASRTLSISIAGTTTPTLTISTSSLAGGTVGIGYGEGLAASGGQPPYAWSISSGGLPPGLTLNTSSGSISGTPSTAGTFSFGVTVTDSSSPQKTAPKTLSITIAPPTAGLAITTTSLPGATVGIGYAQQVEATGGQPPYTWSIVSGLPTGLAINSTSGAIFGTPSVAGSFNFTVNVHDNGSPQKTASRTLSMSVASSTPSPGSIDFTWSPVAPVVGQTVQFAPTTTAGITSWSWTLGDGATSHSSTPFYIYTQAGSVTASLTAQTAAGPLTASHTFTVSSSASSLVADFRWAPLTPTAGADVSFTDASSGATSWTWAFGDSTAAADRNPVHTFARASVYPVKLTVTNAAGASASVTKNVSVDAAALVPAADFTWTPQPASPAQAVQFHDNSSGQITSREWDFNGDGVTDATQRDPAFTYSRGGTYAASLRVTGPYGSSRASHPVVVTAPAGIPVVTSVSRTYPGIFMTGTTLQQRFVAIVQWNGTPGSVRILLNGTNVTTVPASGNSATYTLALAQLAPSFNAATLSFVPVNGAGVSGTAWDEYQYVYPIPQWLQNSVNAINTNNATSYSLHIQVPASPIKAHVIQLPAFVPVIGGRRFGIARDLYATANGTLSNQAASLTLEANAQFTALDHDIDLTVGGEMDAHLGPPEGFYISGGAASLRLSGSTEIEKGIIEAFPQIAPALSIPIIGSALRVLNDRGKVKVVFTPSLEGTIEVSRSQKNAPMDLSGTIEGGATLTGILSVDTPVASAEAWAGGGGSIKVGLPQPFLRGAELHGQIGARFTWKRLFGFGGGSFEAIHNLTCIYHSSDGTDDFPCHVDSSDLDPIGASGAGVTAMAITPIDHQLERYGVRNELVAKPRLRVLSSAVGTSTEQIDIARNVFPGAAPALAVRSDSKLLVWVDQNPALPVFQGTDIVWSYFDGHTWSNPTPIAADTRAEFSPVVGVDVTGRYVAAWLRVRDTAFTTPINTSADLPKFYSRFEIVTATFDPATRHWSAVQPLTDDTAYDFDPQISTNAQGRLMLTWITNAAGVSVSSATSPSSLRYTLWTGSSWGAPAVVDSNLSGLSSHVAAVGATRALIASSVQSTSGNELRTYQWDGKRWSAFTKLAADGNNVSPTAVYDVSEQAHIVWVRDDTLVAATLSGPAEVIRANSGSLGFADAKLVANSAGNLILLWRNSEPNGTVKLYASVYDVGSGRWSADRKLIDDAEWISQTAAALGNDGHVNAAYVNSQIELKTEQVVIGGSPVEIANIPAAGRTDLRILDHALITDLAVGANDITFSSHTPQANDSVSVRVTVHNSGDFGVGTFRVGVYAGLPESGGTLLTSQIVSGTLNAGDTRAVDLTFNFPARNVAVVVNDNGAIQEFTTANNRVVIDGTNSAPQVRVLASVTEGLAPLDAQFDASASTDPENDALTFSWTFGDGKPAATGAVVRHTFDSPGTFPVVVTARDARGAESIAIVTIAVTTPARRRAVTPPIHDPQSPTIISVSPNPVIASGSSQTLTILGDNFQPGCTVTLLDVTNGQLFKDLPAPPHTLGRIEFPFTFSRPGTIWSVEIVNPGDFSSGQFNFPVTAR